MLFVFGWILIGAFFFCFIFGLVILIAAFKRAGES